MNLRNEKHQDHFLLLSFQEKEKHQDHFFPLSHNFKKRKTLRPLSPFIISRKDIKTTSFSYNGIRERNTSRLLIPFY